MNKKSGQLAIGWIITLALASVGAIFGYGKIVQSVDEIKATQIQQTAIVQQLTKNETEILILLGRTDERLKSLENKTAKIK